METLVQNPERMAYATWLQLSSTDGEFKQLEFESTMAGLGYDLEQILDMQQYWESNQEAKEA